MAKKTSIKASKVQVAFEAISIEGGLLSPEWLSKIAQLQAEAQAPADYKIPKGLTLRDEIGRYWRIAEALWNDYRSKTEGLTDTAKLTENFVVTLLTQCLGFDDLSASESITIGDRIYPVGFIAGGGLVPVVVSSPQEALDSLAERFGEDHRKRTAFGLLQEYLNGSDKVLWGIVCDGETLRIVRDNASLTKPAWIEVDLKRMFQELRFADFAAFWLVCHRTRFGVLGQIPEECLLEDWRNSCLTEGTRARDHLRVGVEEALEILGQGFLSHSDNAKLREALNSGSLSIQLYFQEILRLVYRIIFLVTIEERDLLHPGQTPDKIRELYIDGYSLRRLRDRATKRNTFDRFSDIWEGLKIVFKGLGLGEARLGLPALGGLFADDQTHHLDSAKIENRFLLLSILNLCWIKEESGISRVNWRDMGPEELGSVYESLLELVPQITEGGSKFSFARGSESRGNARKTTGSYYTPDSLVQAVLESSLEPVIEATIARNIENPVEALLELSIIDPACGSAHFLLAAARRLAGHVARLAVGGTPSTSDYRKALRQVIGNCIYGVDKNPMALELARTALWLEAMTPDSPLNFLDSHLVCGDALIGVFDLECLGEGIPSDAYKPLTGDDKEICKALAVENQKKLKELKKSKDYDNFAALFDMNSSSLVPTLKDIELLPDDTPQAVLSKKIAHENFLAVSSNAGISMAADMYVCAFLARKNQSTKNLIPLTDDILRALRGVLPGLNVIAFVRQVLNESKALHWKIRFLNIFSKGGFDCVVGNPPWERVKILEEEFFASRDSDIANATSAVARKQKISLLPTTNPSLAKEWEVAIWTAERESKFFRLSGRFPLGGVGDVNTYAVFADHFRKAISGNGIAALILPNGLVTGYTYRAFLRTLLQTRTLASFYGFENEEKIFPDVHNETKFGILTITGRNRPVKRLFLTAHIRNAKQIHDEKYRYSLTAEEIEAINPNTLSLPVFRYSADAEVAATIHRGAPALIRKYEDGRIDNVWGIEFSRLFDMTTDSGYFINHEDVAPKISQREGAAAILEDGSRVYPLYEGKMFWHFDHRYGTYEGQTEKQANKGVLPHVDDASHDRHQYRIQPRYWVKSEDTNSFLAAKQTKNWFFGWRDVGPTERTLVGTVLPKSAFGNTVFLLTTNHSSRATTALCAILSSLVVDYDARQRSNRMNFFVIEQLAVLSPDSLAKHHDWLGDSVENWLVKRAVELYYTNDELSDFARELGCHHLPFRWNSDRRMLIQAEIDAAICHLYGLNRTQVAWLLDSFFVLQKYEEKDLGEYRTKRLVLEFYDSMSVARERGEAFNSKLNPAPASEHLIHVVSGTSNALGAQK